MIGAVIGLNVGCFYLLEALPKWLQGPRRTPALAGVLAIFLVAMAANVAVALRAGPQAANFAFLGLLPPVILMRAALRVSPRGLQYGLLGVAVVAAGAIVAILLRSLAESPQNGWTWTLMALDNPWFSVLAIGGGAAGVLLLFILLGKANGLRRGISQRARVPVLIGLFLAGLFASGLILWLGPSDTVYLPLMLAIVLLDIAETSKPRWVGVALWLNATALLAVTCWDWLARGDIFSGRIHILLDGNPRMTANLAAIAYIVSGVLFILALRGLSSPVTSQAGNRNGMIGMAIAVGTTLLVLWNSKLLDPVTIGLILAGVVVGGGIGAIIARRVAMTAMPQLVAAFHSLVGMAACLVAVAAIYAPEAYGIGTSEHIHAQSLIELGVGLAIGAVTFTGSVIAFAKLNGNMSGAPILLPARHLLNIVLGVAIVGLVAYLVFTGGQAKWAFWAIFALSLVIGITLIIPIGGADMPVVVSMLNSYSGWAAAALGFTLENVTLIITGALVGSSGAILSYIMCKAMNRSFISVILGGFGADDSAAAAGGKVETRP
eukprot:gene11597-11389_t